MYISSMSDLIHFFILSLLASPIASGSQGQQEKQEIMVQGSHIKIVSEYLTKVHLIPDKWVKVAKTGGPKGTKKKVNGYR